MASSRNRDEHLISRPRPASLQSATLGASDVQPSAWRSRCSSPAAPQPSACSPAACMVPGGGGAQAGETAVPVSKAILGSRGCGLLRSRKAAAGPSPAKLSELMVRLWLRSGRRACGTGDAHDSMRLWLLCVCGVARLVRSARSRCSCCRSYAHGVALVSQSSRCRGWMAPGRQQGTACCDRLLHAGVPFCSSSAA
jgi:hypothetical protein